MYVMHFDWGDGGRGANVQYLFESVGKCPPLLIIRGQMSSYTIFHRGANARGGQMSNTFFESGGKCPPVNY